MNKSTSLRVNTIIKTPPRTTSLHFHRLILESPSSPLKTFFTDEFEDIELSSSYFSSSTESISSVSTSISDQEADLESRAVSNAIISTLHLYRSKDTSLSSLSIGNASIENLPSKAEKRQSRRVSRAISKVFGIKKSSRRSATKTVFFDDGREDLIYHGISVKELASTLNTMTLKQPPSLSDIQLQKPEFAYLNK